MMNKYVLVSSSGGGNISFQSAPLKVLIIINFLLEYFYKNLLIPVWRIVKEQHHGVALFFIVSLVPLKDKEGPSPSSLIS